MINRCKIVAPTKFHSLIIDILMLKYAALLSIEMPFNQKTTHNYKFSDCSLHKIHVRIFFKSYSELITL